MKCTCKNNSRDGRYGKPAPDLITNRGGRYDAHFRIDPGYAIVGFGIILSRVDFTPLEYGKSPQRQGLVCSTMTAIYDDLDYLLNVSAGL
ncbi:MAG: hypothetical protein ACLUOF_03050 [Ruminococcus sp.]